MEINIDKQMEMENCLFCSSVAESGLSNIGQITWNNTLEETELNYVNQENKEEFLQYFLSFGAWEKEEIDSIEELNALAIQEIAHRIREFENYDCLKEYKKDEMEGSIMGGIFKHNGSHYITLGL